MRNLAPRATAPGGRWIGIGEKSEKPFTIGRDGRMRPAGLLGRFMTEGDFGGELAINPPLRLSALASQGRLVLQRWQNGVGGRVVSTLVLPGGEKPEPTGAAWDTRGRLAISSTEGPGWLYTYQKGRMRLVGRPRFGGSVIGWVGHRVLIHEKQPWVYGSDFLRPRLTTESGTTVSVGPKAIAVGTDGRIIVLVMPRPGGSKKRGELLSWRDAAWRLLSRPVALPTATGAEYDEGTNISALLPLTPAR